MPKLISLTAREVLDSRGNPTVEVTAKTADHAACAIVPSGASTGSHEALELRDGDKKRYGGKGVLKAVANVNGPILDELKGFDIGDQRKLDEALIALDGTDNKSRLGANAILGVSLACAKLAAAEAKMKFFQYLRAISADFLPKTENRLLPVPMMNILNGGVHADSGLEFQEMMIIPAGAPELRRVSSQAGSTSFSEALRTGAEIFHALKELLKDAGFPTTVGDEGGFAPRLKSHEEGLDFIVRAIEVAGHRPGEDVFIALDCAASEFLAEKSGNKYSLKIRGAKKTVEAPELTDYYKELCAKYPIISIEDGFAEDDFTGWKLMTKEMGHAIQLVGDDLFVTNAERLKKGIKDGIANAILIKLNQIGTLTETIDVINMARAAGYASIVSHRSGETEDTSIAHLAVGLETGQIKTGSLSRTERIAKYNSLLRIQEFLGSRAKFLGKKTFERLS